MNNSSDKKEQTPNNAQNSPIEGETTLSEEIVEHEDLSEGFEPFDDDSSELDADNDRRHGNSDESTPISSLKSTQPTWILSFPKFNDDREKTLFLLGALIGIVGATLFTVLFSKTENFAKSFLTAVCFCAFAASFVISQRGQKNSEYIARYERLSLLDYVAILLGSGGLLYVTTFLGSHFLSRLPEGYDSIDAVLLAFLGLLLFCGISGITYYCWDTTKECHEGGELWLSFVFRLLGVGLATISIAFLLLSLLAMLDMFIRIDVDQFVENVFFIFAASIALVDLPAWIFMNYLTKTTRFRICLILSSLVLWSLR